MRKSCHCSSGQVKAFLDKDQRKENDTIILVVLRETLLIFGKKYCQTEQFNLNNTWSTKNLKQTSIKVSKYPRYPVFRLSSLTQLAVGRSLMIFSNPPHQKASFASLFLIKWKPFYNHWKTHSNSWKHFRLLLLVNSSETCCVSYLGTANCTSALLIVTANCCRVVICYILL